MIKRDKVSIYNKDKGSKVNGIWVEGQLKFIKDIFADIQPYSTQLLLKQYGYNVEVTKRIFCNNNNDIMIGTILKCNNIQLEVRKIISWNAYMEVMCFELPVL